MFQPYWHYLHGPLGETTNQCRWTLGQLLWLWRHTYLLLRYLCLWLYCLSCLWIVAFSDRQRLKKATTSTIDFPEVSGREELELCNPASEPSAAWLSKAPPVFSAHAVPCASVMSTRYWTGKRWFAFTVWSFFSTSDLLYELKGKVSLSFPFPCSLQWLFSQHCLFIWMQISW